MVLLQILARSCGPANRKPSVAGRSMPAMLSRTVRICLAISVTLASSSRQAALDESLNGISVSMVQVRAVLDSRRKNRSVETHWPYWYLVGANHKTGTGLLRSLVGRVFLVLGATYSCQVSPPAGPWGQLTTDGIHNCSDSPDAHIRFAKDIAPNDLTTVRHLAASAGGEMRAVMTIRDPAAMLASAYCYHHRGMEYGLQPAPNRKPWPWPGIMSMGPAEGMEALSDGMFGVIESMTEAAEIADVSDTLVLRFEDITRSSEDFDRSTAAIVDFFFQDFFLQGVLPAELRSQMLLEAQAADLHRTSADEGAPGEAPHSNDKDCEETAMTILPSLSGVYAQIQDAEAMLTSSLCLHTSVTA